jgi:CRP/FNR family transcriptional regulator, anaerobic regulatory protein
MYMQQEIDQYEKLFQVLDRAVILSKQQQENVRKFFKYREFPKDHQLLKEGEISSQLYFLIEGVVRQFYYVEDKEITSRFAFEDDFICSLYSFISRKPSKQNVELVSNCKFFVTSYDGLQYLYENDPDWNKIGRLLTEHYYIELEEQAFLMKTQTAFERYEDLVQRHPDILDRVKLGHLASYLGITQETLSRIRARYRNQQRRRHLAQEI